VLSALLVDVGDKPLLFNEVADNSESWDSYKKEIESHVGPSGFSLFATIDHGAWIKKVGIRRKVLRLIIGNQMIAITMLRHDLTAGLFAPVELILIEEHDGHCSLTYVRPSSLMVVEKNDALLDAAKQLDSKLQAWPRRLRVLSVNRSRNTNVKMILGEVEDFFECPSARTLDKITK
jgi:uncharacterized protein (DUF302 family)